LRNCDLEAAGSDAEPVMGHLGAFNRDGFCLGNHKGARKRFFPAADVIYRKMLTLPGRAVHRRK